MSKYAIGYQINKYTVISEVYKENNVRKVKVQCSCGSIRSCTIGNMKNLNQCSKCYGGKKRTLKVGMISQNNIEIVEIYPEDSEVKIKCHCGETRVIPKQYWRNLRSCGCRSNKKRKGNKSPSFKGHGEITATLFYRIQLGARDRNIEFKIDIEYINKLFIEQNGRCALSGLPITVGSYGKSTTASLDRIDNTKGYVEGNVWWLHKKINVMKNVYSVDNFIQLCRSVVEYNDEIGR